MRKKTKEVKNEKFIKEGGRVVAKKKSKKTLWIILTAVFAVLTAIFVVGSYIVNIYSAAINAYLNLVNYRLEQVGETDAIDSEYYKSPSSPPTATTTTRRCTITT